MSLSPTSRESRLSTAEIDRFCHDMLGGVSRTFALSIPELPRPLSDQIECAYLICRMIDTLEDRPGVDASTRQQRFDGLIRIMGPPLDLRAASEFARLFATEADVDMCGQLMAHADTVLRKLSSFSDESIEAIRDCAVGMISGLRRTPLPPKQSQTTMLFGSFHELERYCHYAAGIVGIMLTRLFALELPGSTFGLDRETMHAGKRFGRGLQITNIVKDHPADLMDGRCFIPRDAATACGLQAVDLLHPSLPIAVRKLVASRAAAHLDVAMKYTLAIPPSAPGVRLFCLQPLLMAVRTLVRVIVHPDPTPDDRPKITRADVQEVLEKSRRWASDDEALARWYRAERALLNDALS